MIEESGLDCDPLYEWFKEVYDDPMSIDRAGSPPVEPPDSSADDRMTPSNTEIDVDIIMDNEGRVSSPSPENHGEPAVEGPTKRGSIKRIAKRKAKKAPAMSPGGSSEVCPMIYLSLSKRVTVYP